VKSLKISFNDKQLDDLSGLFMDLSKGIFLAIFALRFILPSDFLTLLGFLSGGMITVYIGLWISERKKKKNANRTR
jgi:hypothetical protein